MKTQIEKKITSVKNGLVGSFSASNPLGDFTRSVQKEPKGGVRRSGQIQAIVHGNCTFNNTHIIVRDFKGNVILKTSGGLLGRTVGQGTGAQGGGSSELKKVSLGGGKKSSAFAALYLGEEVAKNIKEKGIVRVQLILKGFGKGRSYIHRGLRNGGLQVLSIKQGTNLPHNGCRPRKSRRL